MPVIHERTEDSGLYIKSYIHGSGWITWQITDFGAEILRKHHLAYENKSITRATLIRMIACKLVYTNTSGTSQITDLTYETNYNLKMSNEERKFFEYIRDNEKQIQKSAETRKPKNKKKPQQGKSIVEVEQEDYATTFITTISKQQSANFIDNANIFTDLYLRKDPEIMEAILRKFVYGNLPNKANKYQTEEVFTKIKTLLPSNYCNFCKKYISDAESLIEHIKSCHQSRFETCFENLFKVYLEHKTTLGKKEIINNLKNLEKIKIYASSFARINIFQLYEQNNQYWQLALNNLTKEQQTTATIYRKMLEFLSTEAASFPSITSKSVKIIQTAQSKQNQTIQTSLNKWFYTPEGAEAFLRYCIFNNLPLSAKSYKKIEYFNKCENLFNSIKCPICKMEFNSNKDLSEHVIKYHLNIFSEFIGLNFLSYYMKNSEFKLVKHPLKSLRSLESAIKKNSGISIYEEFNPYNETNLKKIKETLLKIYPNQEQLNKSKIVLSIYLSMINEANHGFPNFSRLTTTTNTGNYNIDFDSLLNSFTKTATSKIINEPEDKIEYNIINDNDIEDNIYEVNESQTESIQNSKALKSITICDLKMELINCPAGDFYMGSPNRELGHAYDEAFHHVEMNNDFYISKFPITQSQYKKLTGENPSKYKNQNCPVTNITQKMALFYCEKLNKLYGHLIPNGYRFDLPTEAQWEYACKADSITSLYNDLEITTTKGICLNLNKIGNYVKNSSVCLQTIGQKAPNKWGIYDMLGNVWEWCKDLYSEDYSGKQELNASNPDDKYSYVIKGGCFKSDAEDCRIATRGAEYEGNSDEYIGFRVALVHDLDSTTADEEQEESLEENIPEESQSLLPENATCEEIHNLINELPRLSSPLDMDTIPENGIYFIFEKGEIAHDNERIVYVGSHDVNGRLKGRLKELFNMLSKDGCILRKNIGRAILNKNSDPYLETWNIDFSQAKNKSLYESKRDKQYEQNIENQVTGYINNSFTVAILEVNDKEERQKLQKQIIATINNCEDCKPSKYWLGKFSPKAKIANGKLWMERI